MDLNLELLGLQLLEVLMKANQLDSLI